MEIERVKVFVRVCVLYASHGYLNVLKDEDLKCLYEECLVIAIYLDDTVTEEIIYLPLGYAYQSVSKNHLAIKYYEKYLCVATEIGDRKGEGIAYVALAIAYQSLGKYHEAIKYNEKYLCVAKEIGDRKGEGIAYESLGSAYSSLAKYREEIIYSEKSLSIATEIGDRQGEGHVYERLGSAYQSVGKYDEAIKCHKKCVSITTEIGDRKGEGNAYRNLGDTYQSLGKYHEAIRYYEKSLSISTEIGDRRGEEYTYGNLGKAYRSLGKNHEGVRCFEKRLSIATEIGDRRGEGHAYGDLGNVYTSQGKFHEAIKYHENSLSIATEMGGTDVEGTAHHDFGVCYELNAMMNEDNADDLLRKSKEHFYKSIHCFELLFEDLKEKDQFKISILDTFKKAYKNLSRICLKTEQTEEALLVSERGRARALGDLLSSKYSITEETTSKRGSLNFTDVNDVMGPTSCILFYDVHNSIKRTASVHIWVLTHRNPSFYEGIEIKSATKSTSAEDPSEGNKGFFTNIVNKSYENMNVREGVHCEDRSLGIQECEIRDFIEDPAVPESSQVAEKETTKGNESDEKVSAETRCIYEEDEENVEDEKPLKSLFEMLIAPVQDKLIQEEIVVIPDGPLFRVPFAALQDPKTGKFLSELTRIRLSPSLTTLKLLQESSDDHHYKSGALIIGNPEIGKVKFGGEEKSFSNLPGAEEEAKEIAELLDVEPLIGKQATKEAVLHKLKVGVSIIHFAAHGSENGQILLAPSTSSATNNIPDEEDYILTMQEAQESGLRAQLVVLSCCHSGRGEIKAEGVVGMTRAFLAAGARAVVASLWAIEDDATKVFMMKFYGHLKKGESASKSLQQAMKEMRETDRYKEPRCWAAFFLIGDDVTIKTLKT